MTWDVDFNLDGSFEKLSSFKMDMSDLEFSCSPKKTEKARSSGKEESPNENLQKDIDSLNFSFDFKELDSFDVGKSLQNGERSCNRKQDTRAVCSSRVDLAASNIHIAEENTAIDNSITKILPASGKETSSKVQNFQGGRGELESEVVDGTSHEAINAVQTTNKEEQLEKGCLSEKEVSKSSNLAIHDVPIKCIARNYAPECTSEPQPDIRTTSGELRVVSGVTENVTDEIIDSDVTCCKNLPQKDLSPIILCAPESNHTEEDKSECSTPNEVVDKIQLAEVRLDLRDRSNSDVQRKLLPDPQEIRENRNLNLKLPTIPLCRGTPVRKVTVKEREIDGNSSTSRTDVVSKPQLHQSSPISTKLFTLGKNRIDVSNQTPATGDGARVTPSNSCVKTTTQTHCNSELLKLSTVPSQSLKIISAQESKLRSIKSSLIFPNLSSLKTSWAFGGKQILSSTGREKERKSGDSEQTTEAGQRSKRLDIGYCTENAEKQNLLISNMKRKALEESNADSMLLKPLKRLSVSPIGFRNSKEPLEKKIEEQVEGMTSNASHDHIASSIENPHVPNTMELEISLDLENDRNVEKADAYSRELEDICNMLRKKHDEAKEMLVRVIVNNSNLLMLNHPIFEDKIRKVQKFAAKLLSKELQTKAA
ncbi:uncharacterized protein At4g18490 isoform X2 [Momordica charantia]|uniref:Uncharacterized protein At4g18490 isoform X2 n=1 Tax=Momordica charantia TaxID=3673 RepID=A0A6J1CKJ5_MOMCH|nr:uncharacterized protein At4g18490 isoform X2 [Momordica charantia]